MSTSQPQPQAPPQPLPKSILKKPSTSSSTSPLDSSLSNLKIKPTSDAERRRLETAIQHAHLIQEQKAILRQNLDYIEELSDYPASTTASAVETKTFLDYMVQFQPSDYDALIEERHVNGRSLGDAGLGAEGWGEESLSVVWRKNTINSSINFNTNRTSSANTARTDKTFPSK
ncbi:hypothetical protein KCU65_g6494, partial [Aureobasidium melanogenum]